LPIQGVSRDQALEQLERVFSSSVFQGAGRSRTLLKFLVEESVADRTERLKEYTIGVEALGKGDAFDPAPGLASGRPAA